MQDGENTEFFDYIILGTGLTETAVSCILSRNRDTKVLHIDRNDTYGSEFATLQYKQLEMHFNRSPALDSVFLEQDRHFNVDLTPKLLLQDSRMKDFLLENGIHELVSFASIKGSFIYTDRLHSIPTSETESLRSSVVSLTQKYRVIKFFWHVRKYFDDTNITMKRTMLEEFQSFGLSEESMSFIGHAIALNLNDEYLYQSPRITYDRLVRYVSSIISYESTQSPYIYPLYGLSELCQSFSRKAALSGALFMLRADIKTIEGNRIALVDPNGESHVFVGGHVIADPRYYKDSRVAKEIIRCIAVLKKGKLDSRNIIFMKKHLKRKNDVFCVVLGSDEYACPEDHEIGIISTVKETDRPDLEVKPVLAKLDVVKHFLEIRKVYENEDIDRVIFTRNVDESPVLDSIYDDIEQVLKKLGISSQ